MHMEFFWGKKKKFWRWMEVVLHNKVNAFMVVKCCHSRWRGDYLRYVGWSVKCFSPCILDIYFWDYTKHSIENNLLVNRHENSLYPRDVRACRLEARVSVDFPEPGAWEVSPQAAAVTWKRNLPPPSCSWSQFAQGRYRLCSSVIRHRLLPQGNKH